MGFGFRVWGLGLGFRDGILAQTMRLVLSIEGLLHVTCRG